MADETHPHGETSTGATPAGLQILVDERELRTLYVNMVRIHTTHEEVVLDLIFSMPNPNPAAGQQQMLFKVTDRVIMSYPTAKRLATSVSQLIKRYEQQFGDLPTQPGQAHRPAPR